MIDNFLSKYIAHHQLPEPFQQTAKTWFIPLAQQIATLLAEKNKPLFIGINGCQGSGKSTLTRFLANYLTEHYQLNVVNLSLDDFYLSQQQRLQLANDIHPLLSTRGVPGTHDIELLKSTLTNISEQKSTPLPSFDKATDNPLNKKYWQQSSAQVDLVLIEGWCWGRKIANTIYFNHPANAFEQDKDSDGTWRQYVNSQLSECYQPLYQVMDKWLMLKAPNFECVFNWRWQQEQHLMATTSTQGTTRIMSKQQVQTFIAYFQRLTEHALKTLPNDCDLVFHLDANRDIVRQTGAL